MVPEQNEVPLNCAYRGFEKFRLHVWGEKLAKLSKTTPPLNYFVLISTTIQYEHIISKFNYVTYVPLASL